MEGEEEIEIEDDMLDMDMAESTEIAEEEIEEDNTVSELRAELEEAIDTIKAQSTELNEVNLLNAKLLYTNKIFKAKSLTESQKVKVLTAFEKAANVNEVKLVFETLTESINAKMKRKTVNEGIVGSASKVVSTPKVEKQPIVESNEMVSRFQKLAGIIKD
jgi:hypothetical protein